MTYWDNYWTCYWHSEDENQPEFLDISPCSCLSKHTWEKTVVQMNFSFYLLPLPWNTNWSAVFFTRYSWASPEEHDKNISGLHNTYVSWKPMLLHGFYKYYWPCKQWTEALCAKDHEKRAEDNSFAVPGLYQFSDLD